MAGQGTGRIRRVRVGARTHGGGGIAQAAFLFEKIHDREPGAPGRSEGQDEQTRKSAVPQ